MTTAMIDIVHGSVYYRGPPITRRIRPRSLCARCGGIAQEDNLFSTRPPSNDRGPCNLSIEVDGREGRQIRRRHSSTGRDRRARGDNPLHCYVVTSGGQKGKSDTTYRESFRTPPPEEFKYRTIRSLPSSPITASPTSSSSPRISRKSLARQTSTSDPDATPPTGSSARLMKQTDCSLSFISLLDNDNNRETPRPSKGRGNAKNAAKGLAHQPLWTEGDPAPVNTPRRSNKGLVHQPLWSNGSETTAPPPPPRRSAKGFAHQPLWTEGNDAPAPAPTPRRSAKAFAHQPLWADGDSAPPQVSRRAAARSVSESDKAAGVRTQTTPSLNSSLTSWIS